jgi:hypothetical protein
VPPSPESAQQAGAETRPAVFAPGRQYRRRHGCSQPSSVAPRPRRRQRAEELVGSQELGEAGQSTQEVGAAEAATAGDLPRRRPPI